MHYLKLFDRSFLNGYPVTGIVIQRDLDYLRRIYHYNKSLIEKYYLDRNFAIKSTNIISRMVENFPLMLEEDVYRFAYVSQNTVEYLGKHYQLTSGIEKGIVHPPYFYGNGGQSILLSEYDSFNIGNFVKNWKAESCVHTMLSPRNDLKLLLPMGLDDGSKGGISTVAIDLMKLSIKWREFVKEQSIALKEDRMVLTKQVFVTKYVLPGFLESDIDFRFMNRIIDTFYGEPIINPKFKHKFHINEPTTQVNRFVENTIDRISNTKLDFVNILNNIHLMFSPNATSLLSFYNLPQTRQNRWAFLVARLRVMCFLYDVAKEKGMSRMHIEDWKKLVRYSRNDNAMLGNFTSEYKKEITGYMDKIMDM